MEKGKGRLWFHVASVGEFNTAKPLLRRLYTHYHITLTYFSFRASKYLQAQKDRGYFHELYRLPPDLPPLVREFEKRIRPEAILIMERELWPFLLLSTKAPKVWLNARSKGGIFERVLSKRFSLILTGEEKSAESFRSYGVERSIPCGNLKFVLEEPPEVGLRVENSKVIVAGSTHPGEELILKEAYRGLVGELADLRLVVAPRHVSRAEEVRKMFQDMGASLKSRGEDGWRVLVVDTLGELFSIYRHASVAVVGGTFVPLGGHNLLEPAYFGKPVLYGPYTHKVEDLRSFLEERELGFCVRNVEELRARLLELLSREGRGGNTGLKEHSQKVLGCYLSNLGSFLEKVL